MKPTQPYTLNISLFFNQRLRIVSEKQKERGLTVILRSTQIFTHYGSQLRSVDLYFLAAQSESPLHSWRVDDWSSQDDYRYLGSDAAAVSDKLDIALIGLDDTGADDSPSVMISVRSSDPLSILENESMSEKSEIVLLRQSSHPHRESFVNL